MSEIKLDETALEAAAPKCESRRVGDCSPTTRCPCRDEFRGRITAYLEALASKGVRPMPRKPSQEMDLAGTRALLGGKAYSLGVWHAMFDAHAESHDAQ